MQFLRRNLSIILKAGMGNTSVTTDTLAPEVGEPQFEASLGYLPGYLKGIK